MIETPLPALTDARQRALYDLSILDTSREERYDRIIRTASALFAMPTVLISLVDSNREWFNVHLPASAPSKTAVLVIPDAAADPRFAACSLVAGAPSIRFYAGCPLYTADGAVIGTLCLIDTAPRSFGPADVQRLCDLAAWAEIELNYVQALQQELALERQRAEHELQRRLNETLQLNHILTALAGSLDEISLLQTLCATLGQTLQVRHSGVGLLDGANAAITVVAEYASPRSTSMLGSVISGASSEALDMVLFAQRPVVIANIQHEPGMAAAHSFMDKHGISALTLVPIIAGGRSIGLLGLDMTGRETFTDDELKLAQNVAVIGGQALERIRTEAALRVSESRQRALLEAIPDLMFQMDRSGRYTGFNANHTTDLIVAPDQFLGHTIEEVLPPELAVPIRSAFERVLGGSGTQVIEYQLTINDTVLDYEARFVRSGADEVLTIVRNITERKNVDRIKSEFVSIVSHELRTPLTSIRGALGLLSSGVAGPLSTDAQAMIDIASHNSERLGRLINDILDIERIETGQLLFLPACVDVERLIRQAIDTNRVYAMQFDVQLTLANSVPQAQVRADADRLMQVLTNLLSNAVKFSPPGSTVVVEAARIGGGIRISVADSGEGIPVEFHSRIFQKFAQADTSDMRQKGGTGLGLYISKAIVERSGGQIGFYNAPGGGAVFYVDLPIDTTCNQ